MKFQEVITNACASEVIAQNYLLPW